MYRDDAKQPDDGDLDDDLTEVPAWFVVLCCALLGAPLWGAIARAWWIVFSWGWRWFGLL